MANKPRTGTLSGGKVVSYALGDVANNLSFQMTSMFLMVYMTEIAGVSAAMAGTIYGVTKVWAGFCDLFAGQTVDRANTRWGRLRPWILFGSTPLAIVFVLLFSTPANLSPTLVVAWILLLDAAFQLAYSFVNIPYGSLSAAITQDSVDRSKLSGARSIASAVTGVALSAIIAPQFSDVTGDGVRLQFTLTTLALGVLAVILYLICFANTREVVPRGAGKISIKRTMGMVRQNGPLLTLCLGAFFLLSAMFTMNAVGMYYARYVLGNASWFTMLMLAQTVGTILIASFVPAITVKFGKRNGYVLASVVAVIGYLTVFIAPGGSLPVAILAWFLLGVGTGGTNSLMFSMQADTVDYGEWKTGVRAEGGAYSVLSFIRKTGQGLGGWAGAFVIGAFGYMAKAPTQSPEALTGIRVACGVLPAVLAVVATLVMLRYPLTVERHGEIVAELNERRTQGAVRDVHGVDTGAIQVQEVGDGRTTRVTKPSRGNLPIITFFEKDGSGATQIAPAVAEALGVKYIGQKFTSDELATMDAAVYASESGFDRWVRSMSYGATTDSDMAQAMDLSSNHQIAAENTEYLLREVADGAVVLGRNGALVLGRAVGAFHVRLTAPMGMRIERVAAETGLSPSAAAERIEAEDRIRAEMSRRLYQWDPNTDEYYDLVINTGTVTYEQVVEMIVGMYRSKYPATPPSQE